ncbi:MAG: PLP-dependent aminotransferase family protein [Roseburia sp.]
MFNNWKPQKNSTVPVYIQIREFLREQIYCGKLPIGEKLPPQRQLAEIFSVNRSTIVAALDDLLADDLLEGKGKSGTIIKNNNQTINAPAPPDWISYIQSGNYQANKRLVQEINFYEHKKGILCISRPEIAPELFSKDILHAVSESCLVNVEGMGYEHQNGLLSLRKELCKYLAKSGIHVVPSQILIVSGAIQAIYLIAESLLRRGSTILTENPSWIYFVNIFQSAGMRLHGVPIGAQGLKLDVLEKMHSQTGASILYTIPNMHNPTGTTMPEQKKKDLIALCQKRKLPIMEDDAYRELYFSDTAPKPLKAYDKTDQVLYMGTASKVLFPGLRLGWLVGPKPVIDHLADIKTQIDTGTSTLSQYAILHLLKNGLYEEHMNHLRIEMKKRRDYTLQLLNKYFKKIARWEIPQGGIYIWLHIIKPLSMTKLFHRCIENGVLFNPESVYSSQGGNHIRISYSQLSQAEMEQALIILAHTIEEL